MAHLEETHLLELTVMVMPVVVEIITLLPPVVAQAELPQAEILI
jgi:hypothetical protein